jgi:hypothetical protein
MRFTDISLLRDCIAQRRVSKVRGHNFPDAIYYLSNTNIVRASERQHPVQCRGSDGNLGRLGLVGARSKRIADYALVSADRCLTLARRCNPLAFCHAMRPRSAVIRR